MSDQTCVVKTAEEAFAIVKSFEDKFKVIRGVYQSVQKTMEQNGSSKDKQMRFLALAVDGLHAIVDGLVSTFEDCLSEVEYGKFVGLIRVWISEAH